MITPLIICVFLVGYLFITLEELVKVNKVVPAMLMCVCSWVLYTFGAADFVSTQHPHLWAEVQHDVATFVRERLLIEHLGDIAGTLFFLMGAMTIVEIIDTNGGFNFVRDFLASKSKRSLLWKLAFATFFLSAVLDNLTTSIVMIMVLRKIVGERKERMIYAGLIIIAANAGGAFSPVGDVTTIMLWLKGRVSAGGVLTDLFLPSLVAMVVPALILSVRLKGVLPPVAVSNLGEEQEKAYQFGRVERSLIFYVGVLGILFVPIFHSITHLPPYLGILLVLALLWGLTEIFYRRKAHRDCTTKMRVTQILRKVDMTTILFLLSILLTVSVLKEAGILPHFGVWLNEVTSGNHYLITSVIGLVSSLIDNSSLVAGTMSMYGIEAAGDFAKDGLFWQLLAYCAGVGGSMLIIGSAAGVVMMNLEKISFGWYLKNISWVALLGYLAGILAFCLIAFCKTALL